MHQIAKLVQRMLLVSIAVVVISGGILISTVEDSRDLIRLRNALIFEVGSVRDMTWSPDNVPADFLWDTGNPPEKIVLAVRDFLQVQNGSNPSFELTLDVARQLGGSASKSGIPIQGNTELTYQQITENGLGYCSDYTQVMNGLMLTAGVPIREWGMSFDRFGGDGHAFSEVYSRELDQWIFVDSFYSFYIIDGSERPISVLEFRDALLNDASENLHVTLIDPNNFRMPSTEYALQYYQKGADAFFMYWGNNVFAYDQNPIIKPFGKVSRAMEQAVAVLLGLQPKIVIAATEANKNDVQYLGYLRILILLLVGAGLVSVVSISYLVYRRCAAR